MYDTFDKEKDTTFTPIGEAEQWLGQLDDRSQASTAEKRVCVDEEEEDKDTAAIEPLETETDSEFHQPNTSKEVVRSMLCWQQMALKIHQKDQGWQMTCTRKTIFQLPRTKALALQIEDAALSFSSMYYTK